MSAENEVYPLASKGGAGIPFDVGEAIGSQWTAFTNALSSQKTLDADMVGQLAILISTQDVAVCFGGDASVAADTHTDDQVMVLADRPVSIIIRNASFKTKGFSASGSLYFNFFRRWETLDKEVLQGRM